MRDITCYEADGKTLDKLIEYNDCYEKTFYLLSKGIIHNPYVIFADDINIRTWIGEDNGFSRVFCDDKYRIFERITLDTLGNIEETISSYLKQGYWINFSTGFDLLELYCWYSSEATGEHTDHFSSILGEDLENYFIVEDPRVIRPEYKIVNGISQSIFTISKSVLLDAMKRFCRLEAICLKSEYKQKKDDACVAVTNLTKRIIHNYKNNTSTINGYFTGKLAIELLLFETEKLVRTGKTLSIYDNIYEQYLIRNRYVMYQKLLETMQANKNQITRQMQVVIELWDLMRYCSEKRKIKADSSEDEQILKALRSLAEEIDVLMNFLVKCL